MQKNQQFESLFPSIIHIFSHYFFTPLAQFERQRADSGQRKAKTAYPTMPHEASTAAAVPKEDGLRSILENHICSITHELIVEPVMAEDGHHYEKKPMTRWLATNSRSPKTNLPMGKSLVDSVVAKQTIADLIRMDGVVDEAAAAAWHFRKGVAAAEGRDREGTLESFRIEGAELDKRLTELLGEVKNFRQRAAEEGGDVSHFSFVPGSMRAGSMRAGSVRAGSARAASSRRAQSRRRNGEMLEMLRRSEPAATRRSRHEMEMLAQRAMMRVRQNQAHIRRNIARDQMEAGVIRLDDSSNDEAMAPGRGAEGPPEDTRP